MCGRGARRAEDRQADGRHPSQEERGQVSIPIDVLVNTEWEVVGSLGNPQPDYPELLALVAQKKLNPARLVTRQIALGDVTDTLERMTRFETVGFEALRGSPEAYPGDWSAGA